MSERPGATSPESDVCTVLLIAATLIVATSTIFLCIKSNVLFGAWHPFGGA